MNDIIKKLKDKNDLSSQEIEAAMKGIMTGDALKDQMASFLLALREKGPSVEEITGAAKIMREFVIRVETGDDLILDIVGTGGDKTGTFNISTISAFVVASCQVPIAKHGNRSVSSRCGSADILEGLGVNINMPVEHLANCLKEVGLAFLFAQKLHPAMKNVAPVRKELGVETIFNILGPLTNPAMAAYELMGIYKKELVEPMAHVLKNLGLKRAMVVHGSDGLDEVTTTAETFVSEYNGKEVCSYTLDPKDFGIDVAKPEDLKGGELSDNIAIAEEILKGEKGPKRDIVLFNAGCALYVVGKCSTIQDGIKAAQESLDSGRTAQKLEALKEFTNRVQ